MLPLILLLAAPAGAENRWAGHDPDIVVTATVGASPAEVYAYLLDLTHQPALWPADCATGWTPGAVTQGLGASMEVRYVASEWNRNLTMILAKAQEDLRVTLDHPGDKGFITTWTLRPDAFGTQVELHTWIQAPPWPFRGPYFKRVKPAWQDCHQRTVDALGPALAAARPAEPEAPEAPESGSPSEPVTE